MAGQKLERAKDAAIEALRHLGPMDMFSVVVYDHNVSTVVSAQHAKNIEWIEERIRQIRSGGNTALFGGVSQGAAEVRKNLDGNYVHRIILLSDGIANVGPSSPEDLGRLGAALIKEDISVTTVGVGTGYNEDLMTSLSQNSDGNTYFVESSRDLSRIFTAELGDVLSVVAKKVNIIIELPNGVKPLNIIGREGRIKGRMVELSLNQLYGSQEKYVLIEVEIPGGKSGEKKDIAYVNVSYENPFTQKKETSSGRVYARFSKDKIKVKKSANIAVQKEYYLNLNAISQDKAISLSDKGKKNEAVSELKKSADKLREVGQEYNDEDLLKRAEEMEVQAGQIEKEGMTKKYRKVLRTDSYQMKNQQMSK
jgi:Ca-activated chloride channel family protein